MKKTYVFAHMSVKAKGGGGAKGLCGHVIEFFWTAPLTRDKKRISLCQLSIHTIIDYTNSTVYAYNSYALWLTICGFRAEVRGAVQKNVRSSLYIRIYVFETRKA